MQTKKNDTNSQIEHKPNHSNVELESMTAELINARIDLHKLLMVLRFQAYLAIPLIIGYILYIGKRLLVPILISFVLAYLIMLIKDWFYRVLSHSKIFGSLLNKKSISPISFVLSLLFAMISFYFLVRIANNNITELISKTNEYHTKLKSIIDLSAESMGIQDQVSWEKISTQFHIGILFKGLSQFFIYVFSETFSILLYTSFLLASWKDFHKVIVAICIFKGWDPKQYMVVRDKVNKAIQEYLYIKIIVSMITACISLVIMGLIGLDFAIFWSLLIFLLNFIPTVGSIVACAIPSLLGLIQFDHGLNAALLVFGLMSTQIIIGNVIEPRMMGHKLNLNTFMIVVFLAVWGSLWGVAGMFLCVPIMVIMLLVCKEFEATGAISLLLSADGKIFSENEARKGSTLKKTLQWLKRKKKAVHKKRIKDKESE
jgi:AI-2 transport protein TqsA